ncbi:Csu type fimbrial protein [Pontixanthobacter aquaemixtae]|uniref:Fimbrial major subunit CsuA/B family protein n=1 Tax=Pontixanthobacter aquaemixtae TaxID=1958940 RepID=A0A844ZSN9_9SPHN|nr:spore coat U domain-containing protein [Pontixanthobacter aquaemixtae]MXO89817.1 fimbrial major subunit CsuA/B family protein [Pontixanthobacter aquaemixtae]
MYIRTAFCALVLPVAAFGSGSAFAQQASDIAMPVSGEVRSRCDIVATPMRFQIANVGANSSSDATATIHLRCTQRTFFTVTIDYGQNANGTQRRMISGDGDLLAYDVYRNAARTRPWGLGNRGVRFYASGAAEGTFNVYGRIPNVSTFNAAGSYRDTLTVQIEF